MTPTALAAQLAAEYDIDPAAARAAVDTYAVRFQDPDLYDAGTGTLTDDGAAVIRDQLAADYHGMTPAAERHDNLLDLIRRAGDEACEHQSRADEWTARRDVLIREAIGAGVRVADLVAASGLSRARVYQIRDGRR